MFDQNGRAQTELVKTGKLTYYDFWPGEGAGKLDFDKDQRATMHKVGNLSLEDLQKTDIGIGENRSAEGLLQFKADANSTLAVAGKANKQYNNRDKAVYNGLSHYNASKLILIYY
ncbi:MAG: hypothetical protein EOP48_04040 [Sphingobacteriales bacterium]|nr:MAG: hypothetical protein EOP48_04040 [Sphingobacteriales bacterium]